MQHELLRRAHQGDRKARDAIVKENLGLVYSVIKRFQNRGYEHDDLFQLGSIGLIKAIDNFDESFGVMFSTYAVPLIMGEIKRFIRDDGPVKVSRTLKELNVKLRYLSESILKEEGREAGVCELAEQLGVEVCDIVEALDAALPISSLDEPVNERDGNTTLLSEIVVDDNATKESDILNRMLVNDVMNILSERDKSIIYMRFFQRKTQMEIARMLGISQVQISRIEKKALKMMRNHVG